MHSPMGAKQMSFAVALNEVQAGHKVTRQEWNDPEVYVLLRDGFLCITNATGTHRLLVSEGDLRGKDWVVVLGHMTAVTD